MSKYTSIININNAICRRRLDISRMLLKSSSLNYANNINNNQFIRCLSAPKKNFLSGFIDNLKEEYNKNKELKENISEFRKEAKKLEESDALQEARKKYKSLEEEHGQKIKEKITDFSEKIKESDFVKKASDFTDEFSKQAQKAAETVSKQTEELSKTNAYKVVSENVKVINKTIDDATHLSEIKPYTKPKILRKRSELDEKMSQKVYESNETDTGMVLHKDSKWYQSWQNFKDDNKYINKLFDLKTQYDESDNLFIRASRSLTEKFGSVFGGMFKSTEMSEVLTEIVKMEPDFDLNEFIKKVQYDFIPNIMESLCQNELEILKDWCTETAFNMMTHPLKQCEQLKMNYFNQVLDINNVDIAAAKVMEQGPILIVTFTAQQIIYITDNKGTVVEGDKEKIKRVQHVWALCRDQEIMDPNSAWRLMECGMHISEQFV